MKNIHILPTSQCKGSFKDCFKPLDECVCDIMKCTCINFHVNCFSGLCRVCGLPPKEEPSMISDWLEQNRNPEIDRQVENEAEQLSKQKTLEEAAESLTNDFPALEVRFNMTNEEIHSWFLEALQKGAKWQQKNSYSEEEVVQIVLDLRFKLECNSTREEVAEWFKQLKKK